RSISAKNLSSSRVWSRTAPVRAGAGTSQTIQAWGSVSKRGISRPLDVDDPLHSLYKRLTRPVVDARVARLGPRKIRDLRTRSMASFAIFATNISALDP